MKAFKWWRNLKPHIQQTIADKHYPDDDFTATTSNINRIEKIYLKEND